MRHLISLTIAILSCGFSLPAYADRAAIILNVNVSTELHPYSDIVFQHPAYVSMALQNIGVPISLSKPLKILTAKSVQIGSDRLTYLRKDGKTYFYTGSVALPLGKEMAVAAELDTTNLRNGVIQIRFYPPFSGMIPGEFIVKIESKLQALASPMVQKQLISYLTENLHGGSINRPADISRLLESIAFDAYNETALSRKLVSSQNMLEVGSSEELSSQIPLIASVLIWLFGLPIFLYVVRKRRAQHS